jgi:catechol 2,3-dioxygenase-like lactoylglutathione lyase family enzyme
MEETEMADTQPRSAAERDLRLLHLDHFNVPVRDLEVARKFYCEVLGGEVVVEAVWPGYNLGRPRGAHLDIQLFPGEANLNTFWQPWGFPAPDQVFPHRAFRVKDAAKLDELKAKLEGAQVPFVLVTKEAANEGEQVSVSLYFHDPDGNQLELRCEAYPFRRDVQVGGFDPAVQYYPWREWRALVPDGGSLPDGGK